MELEDEGKNSLIAYESDEQCGLSRSESDEDIGEALWCSHRILNDEGELTLDDWTLDEMSRELDVSVRVSNDSILEIFERDIHG